MGPWVKKPKLWHWSRRGVAMGVALGVFFGLIIPVAQIPASVAAAVVMRANIPAAIASTLVSNPVTFGPIYYGAYKLGVWITGAKKTANPAAVFATAEVDEDASMWTRITALGKPLLVGLSITAVISKRVAKSSCWNSNFSRASCPLQLRWTHAHSRNSNAAGGTSPRTLQ